MTFLAFVKCPAGIFRHLARFPQALVLCAAALIACSDDGAAAPGETPDSGAPPKKACSGKFKIEDLNGNPATEDKGKSHIS